MSRLCFLATVAVALSVGSGAVLNTTAHANTATVTPIGTEHTVYFNSFLQNIFNMLKSNYSLADMLQGKPMDDYLSNLNVTGILSGFLSRLQNGGQNPLQGISNSGMKEFLSNLNLTNVIPGIFSGLQNNPLIGTLEKLLSGNSVPEWMASVLSDRDFYKGLFEMMKNSNNKNITGLAKLWSEISPFLPVLSKVVSDSVTNGLEQMNVSESCSKHTAMVLSGVLSGKMWAFQYLDSLGKFPSGLLEGALYWPGSFHECVTNEGPADVATEDSFKGQYCLLKIPLPMSLLQSISTAGNSQGQLQTNGIAAAIFVSMLAVQEGVCLPNSCSSEDVTSMINQGIGKLMPDFPQIPPPLCHKDQDFPKDKRAIIAVAVLGFIGFIILMGTLYDVITLLIWQHKKSNKPEESKTNNVKLSEIFSNGNGFVKMSEESDTVTPDKHMNIYSIQHTTDVEADTPKVKMANGDADVTKEPKVTMANGDADVPKDPKVTSNGVPEAHKEVKANHSEKEARPNDAKETRPKPGILGGLLMAFSLYTNIKKLVSTQQRSGTLGAVHGVRFFSMTWVVLGHTYLFHLSIADNTLAYAHDFQARWTAQAILNATVSVDSFFTLSGLLVSYLTLNEMRKAKSAKINWAMFYFHRFWRLTPPYMLIILLYVPLFQYFGSGPQWPNGQVEPVTCNTHWWKNLLYINNFHLTDSCLGWTWYLANDMQFYVISPLILVPLFYSKIAGFVILSLLFLGTFIANGVISYTNGYGPGLDTNPTFMDNMYNKPWCRIGPYLVGLIVGYVLFKTKCKVTLHKSTVLLGWSVAAILCLSTLYGLYGHTHGHPLTTEAAALFNALHRTAWGVGLGWVLFACCTGYGGVINKFLSWKAFIPLGRLTYMVYLLHLIVLTYFNLIAAGPIYVSDVFISYLFVGNLVFTYGLAFCCSLAFEAPMMGLERVVFRRK